MMQLVVLIIVGSSGLFEALVSISQRHRIMVVRLVLWTERHAHVLSVISSRIDMVVFQWLVFVI
jgi:hypothetical protein